MTSRPTSPTSPTSPATPPAPATARLLAALSRDIGLPVCALYSLVSSIAFLSPLLTALGLRPLVDGAASHHPAAVAFGAILTGAALLLTVLAPTGYRWATVRMRERSRMAVERRLLSLATAAPRIDHFERGEYLDRLHLLRRGTEQLADGMALLLIGPIVVVQLLAAAVLLGRVEPWLALAPVVALPAIRLGRWAAARGQQAEQDAAEHRRMAQRLFEATVTATSATELRVLGLQDDLLGRHRRAADAAHRRTERAALRSLLGTAGGWLLFAVVYTAALLVVIDQAAHHRATAGDVAATAALAAAVTGAAGRLADLTGALRKVTIVAGHHRWLEQQAAHGVPAHPAATLPDRLRHGITLADVGFGYGDQDSDLPDVLTGLSLTLPAGAVVAIVGENGAGKTTLVKLLCGLYAPRTGRILLDGVDLATVDPAAHRRRTAAGFQDFVRWELTAGTAVGVGDPDTLDRPAAARAALDRVGADFVDRLPQGADTPLGLAWTGGVELSGGQWQKLALARALVRTDPLLLVLDEPTAALDPRAEHAVFSAVAEEAARNRASGRITVLISHRVATTRMADLIVVLDRGRIREAGRHEELMAAGGLYAELYRLQADAYRLAPENPESGTVSSPPASPAPPARPASTTPHHA